MFHRQQRHFIWIKTQRSASSRKPWWMVITFVGRQQEWQGLECFLFVEKWATPSSYLNCCLLPLWKLESFNDNQTINSRYSTHRLCTWFCSIYQQISMCQCHLKGSKTADNPNTTTSKITSILQKKFQSIVKRYRNKTAKNTFVLVKLQR